MPTQIPLFPLGTVLFPGMPMPLQVFEPRYRRMMDDHGTDSLPFGISLIQSARAPQSNLPSHDIGTAASLVSRHKRPDGRWDIVAKGERRFRIIDIDESLPYTMAA